MQTLFAVQLCVSDMINEKHPAFKDSILRELNTDENSTAIEEYNNALESFAARRMKFLHQKNSIQAGLNEFEANKKSIAEKQCMRACFHFMKATTKTDEVLSKFKKVRTFLTVLHTLFP